MSETDAVIEHYHSLKPFHFSELVRFELRLLSEPEWDFWDAIHVLTIELKHSAVPRPGQPVDPHSLLLTFNGVRQLEFVPSDFLIVPVNLDVVCIRDSKWEGINYRVYNSEQDIDLSFICHSFEAKIASSESEAS